MKRTLLLILVLVAYFHIVYGVIDSTLTRTSSELTSIRNTTSNFLVDTKNMKGGDLSRSEEDAELGCTDLYIFIISIS